MHPSDRETIVRILTNAFDQNPRIRTMIRPRKAVRNIRIMSEFACHLIEKFDGVYLSADKTTVLLYYKKSQYRLSFGDKIRYMYMFLRAIKISQFFPTQKREKLIKSLRPDYEDYLYVWVLGSDPGKNNIRGLADIRGHLFSLQERTQLPILIETTLEKLLKLYRYVGFEVYRTWRDEEAALDLWFLERPVSPKKGA